MNLGSDGKTKIIQEGSNGRTCVDPDGAPICADKAAMEWVQGWQEKGPTPQKMGFIYMLKGDAVPIPTRRMRLPITIGSKRAPTS